MVIVQNKIKTNFYYTPPVLENRSHNRFSVLPIEEPHIRKTVKTRRIKKSIPIEKLNPVEIATEKSVSYTDGKILSAAFLIIGVLASGLPSVQGVRVSNNLSNDQLQLRFPGYFTAFKETTNQCLFSPSSMNVQPKLLRKPLKLGTFNLGEFTHPGLLITKKNFETKEEVIQSISQLAEKSLLPESRFLSQPKLKLDLIMVGAGVCHIHETDYACNLRVYPAHDRTYFDRTIDWLDNTYGNRSIETFTSKEFEEIICGINEKLIPNTLKVNKGISSGKYRQGSVIVTKDPNCPGFFSYKHMIEHFTKVDQSLISVYKSIYSKFQRCSTLGQFDKVVDRFTQQERDFYYRYYSYIRNQDELPSLMKDFTHQLMDDINNHQIDSLEIATYIHRWLVEKHPFNDGNGRTARIFMNWVLAKLGVKPISFPKRLEYSRAVNESSKKKSNIPFLEYLKKREKAGISTIKAAKECEAKLLKCEKNLPQCDPSLTINE